MTDTTVRSQAAGTGAQRAAALRKRREELGIKQLVVFAHVEDHPAIKALAAKLAVKRCDKC